MAVDKNKAIKAADKHIAKQNYGKALNELLKVEKSSAKDINLLNKIGDLYSKLNKGKEAISYFSKVADAYQQGGFNLKAIAVFKKIVRIDDRFMDARDKLVNLYIQQGHHSEARGELRGMAEYYYKENLLPRALNSYEKLIKIDPGNLEARLKITEILMREGRRGEATEHFIAMARELLTKNMLNEAQKVIGQGLKVEPANEALRILIAQAHIAEGKIDEALTRLTEICRENENNLEALKILGQTYLDRGQLRDANACFLRALHLSKEETASVEDVARQFIKSGQLDDAFQALLHVSDIFLERQDHEEAIRLFRGILYADENHMPSLELLVKIYEESEQVTNATLALEKIIHIHLTRGDYAKAKAAIENLLEIDPNNQEWRNQLNTLNSKMQGADAPEDVQVFDDHAMDLDDNDITDMGGNVSLSLEPDDPATRIANLLTDAEMCLKYGTSEDALKHLTAVKEMDLLNIEANEKLKQIYLDKKQVDNAVGCMVCLVNAFIDKQNYEMAGEHIKEIASHRPDIAKIHQGRLDGMLHEESQRLEEENAGFDLDFSQAQEAPAEDMVFAGSDQQEVVDFRNLDGLGENMAETETQEEKDHYSLDIPSTGLDKAIDTDFDTEDHEPYSLDMPPVEESPPDMPPVEESPPAAKADMAAEDLKDIFQAEPAAEAEDIDRLPTFKGSAQSLKAEDDALAEEDITEIIDLPEKLQPKSNEKAQAPPVKEAIDDSFFAEEVEANEDQPSMSEVASSMVNGPLAVNPDEAFEDQILADESTPQGTAPAPLGSEEGSLASELEEIDFFISVEAFDDANNLIEEALQQFGDHPLVLERQQEILDKTQNRSFKSISFDQAAPPEQPVAEPAAASEPDDGTDFYDLAAELNEELFAEDHEEINDATSQEEIRSVDELFQEFKKGVDEQIDENDFQTHYDLGIAYKEMGLLEEAIHEFEKATNDSSRHLECLTMIGNCLVELGRLEEVVDRYRAALAESVDDQSRVVMTYELGRSYESIGEVEKALESFLAVQKMDATYRDLEERIEALV